MPNVAQAVDTILNASFLNTDLKISFARAKFVKIKLSEFTLVIKISKIVSFEPSSINFS
jgi:hypothetical protein